MAEPSLGERARATLKSRPLVVAGVVVLLCILSLSLVDRSLAEFYKHSADPETIVFFRYISNLGDATGYLIGMALLVFAVRIGSYFRLGMRAQETFRRITDACVFIVVSLALSGAIVHLLKISIGRYRPQALFEQGLFDVSPFTAGYLNSSFPSGHSQAVWAIAVGLALVYPRYDLAYVAVAALVSYSRVVTVDHYFSDVLFGSLIGIVTPILLKRAFFDRRSIELRLPVPASFTSPVKKQPSAQDERTRPAPVEAFSRKDGEGRRKSDAAA